MESFFLQQLLAWSPAAVTSVLAFAIFLLIKKIDKDSKVNEERAAALRTEINTTLNSFGERLSRVERDYVKIESFHRELSGWRHEINRMSDIVHKEISKINQNLIQLLSQGKI